MCCGNRFPWRYFIEHFSWMILCRNCNTAFHQPLYLSTIYTPCATAIYIHAFYAKSVTTFLLRVFIVNVLHSNHMRSDLARAHRVHHVYALIKLNAGTIVPKLVCHRYLPCFALIFCECTFFCNLAIFLPLDSCLADSDFLFVYLWKPVLTFFCVWSNKNGVHLFCRRHCWFWS